MNGSHFDNVSKVFAQRRMSRRRVLAGGGAGIAAGALAATRLNTASAQEATAIAPAGEPVTTLFVQSFQSGSVVPKDGEDGTFTLTLEHGLGQTVYFTDRPAREVGTSPTYEFLAGLGFSPDNPPNAALVVETAPGDTDIAVMELLNPRYEFATHTVTYDVKILEQYEQTLGISFAEQPTDLSQLHPSFSAAHLFIDGCPDTTITCYDFGSSTPDKGALGDAPFCYWESYGCIPCAGNGESEEQIVAYWNAQCNDRLPVCGGNCYAEWNYA